MIGRGPFFIEYRTPSHERLWFRTDAEHFVGLQKLTNTVEGYIARGRVDDALRDLKNAAPAGRC